MKKFSIRIFILILIISLCATVAAATTTLIPGGQVIGMQLQDGTVTVSAFDEDLGAAAKAAGLAKGDQILQIDDTKIQCVQDVRTALCKCDDRVNIRVSRNGKIKTLTMRPPLTADGPRLGIYLRQGTTGLGTVTYYDPQNGSFGALGHGVNSSDGSLLTMQSGETYPCHVFSVKKGKAGAPGQLLGSLSDPTVLGKLQKNTEQGVFGKTGNEATGDPLPVAETAEITTGPATIRSTIGENGLQEYSVEILKIYPNTSGRNRNLLLKVTDTRLVETTGGIVQGMSGSPIIQNGRLIGAVTHVLVNDPTMGYGIFIENMLDAAA